MTEVFVSGFADLILDYIDFYEESGRKRTSIYYPLNFFIATAMKNTKINRFLQQ